MTQNCEEDGERHASQQQGKVPESAKELEDRTQGGGPRREGQRDKGTGKQVLSWVR